MKYSISNDEELLSSLKSHIQKLQTRIAKIYLEKYMTYTDTASKRLKETNLQFKEIEPLSEELAVKMTKIDNGELTHDSLTKEERDVLNNISTQLIEISEKIERGEIDIFYFEENELDTIFKLTEKDISLLVEDFILHDLIQSNEKKPVQES